MRFNLGRVKGHKETGQREKSKVLRTYFTKDGRRDRSRALGMP